LKLGCLGFGGPAVHLALLEDEVVTRRGWLDRERFLDLVGATNLIPGPNSTEMVIHVGLLRAGWLGWWVAGMCFVGPAVTISAVFGWFYVRYGQRPDVRPFLAGVQPAVLALIGAAIWRLGRTAIKSWQLAALGVVAFAVALPGGHEITVLLAGGVIGTIWLRLSRGRPRARTGGWIGALGTAAATSARPATAVAAGAAATAAGASGAAVSLTGLGLFFLKVGAVLYGTGYVLVAFLEGGLVDERGWLTSTELVDAIAVGQMTPGPLLSTASFIGYVVEGPQGAIVASLAIFLPSFVFVAILGPLVGRLRRSAWFAGFLDSVNVCAVALMLATTIDLGRTTLTSWPAWTIGVVATVLVVRFRVHSIWLVLGGAAIGRLLFAWF